MICSNKINPDRFKICRGYLCLLRSNYVLMDRRGHREKPNFVMRKKRKPTLSVGFLLAQLVGVFQSACEDRGVLPFAGRSEGGGCIVGLNHVNHNNQQHEGDSNDYSQAVEQTVYLGALFFAKEGVYTTGDSTAEAFGLSALQKNGNNKEDTCNQQKNLKNYINCVHVCTPLIIFQRQRFAGY